MKTCPEVIARQDKRDAEGRLMWFLTKANSNSEVGTENFAGVSCESSQGLGSEGIWTFF